VHFWFSKTVFGCVFLLGSQASFNHLQPLDSLKAGFLGSLLRELNSRRRATASARSGKAYKVSRLPMPRGPIRLIRSMVKSVFTVNPR
jgi:hypothetical protein